MGFFVFGFAIIGVLVLLSIPYWGEVASDEWRAEVTINDKVITAEIVSEPAEMSKGLGGRESLGEDKGMLFIFKEEGIHPFWMKGMRFPIDIIWIDGREVIGVSKNVQPEPGVPEEYLSRYSPPVEINKVLEVNSGVAQEMGAKPGDKIKIKTLPLL